MILSNCAATKESVAKMTMSQRSCLTTSVTSPVITTFCLPLRSSLRYSYTSCPMRRSHVSHTPVMTMPSFSAIIRPIPLPMAPKPHKATLISPIPSPFARPFKGHVCYLDADMCPRFSRNAVARVLKRSDERGAAFL